MFNHYSVLLTEAIDLIEIKKDGIYVDATLGGGGHSAEILNRLTTGHLYAFDQDAYAISQTSKKLAEISEHFTMIKSNFVHLKAELALRGVTAIDGIIFDLGVSSPQLDDAQRGFSFHQDAPLDMRMDQSAMLTAKEVVNEWEFHDLLRIFSRYGEEKFAKQVARKIEAHRQIAPIETTLELVDIVKEAIPAAARRTGGHPAKRIFQAIRIAVNDELRVFETALEDALTLLKVGGRIGVITFHSLEDRICKQMFVEVSKEDAAYRGMPAVPEAYLPKFEVVTRKPVIPSAHEIEVNKRSRSAKLRVIERIRTSEQ
ncbi:MAG: 16S rRNA (cytosine(1402)-N(4))-methyltransferase RsmH [Defluviitaleaceae bacterium]|nr:16S rRNA (cytosine(1402)-N(4))-methyltransferase RsmH [Defluviitaleaceae bacterium]